MARPLYLIAGWFWYLVMLFPVIGVIQVGVQAMADRYTYLPLLGPFIMISWGVADAATGYARKKALIASGSVAVGLLSFSAWHQIGFWKSDILLFSRALEVAPANPTAYANFGHAHLNEGIILKEQGNFDEALKHFTIVTARSTGDVAAMAHNNMGLIYAMRGKNAEAEAEYATSLQNDSAYADPYYNLGLLHLKGERLREAAASFREAVRLNPGDVKARRYLEEIAKIRETVR